MNTAVLLVFLTGGSLESVPMATIETCEAVKPQVMAWLDADARSATCISTVPQRSDITGMGGDLKAMLGASRTVSGRK